MTSLKQRAELHLQIWAIANEVRGAVDGFKGLFADFDTTSNRLGSTVKEKYIQLASVLEGVKGLSLGDFGVH